jgi:hypothetical protein
MTFERIPPYDYYRNNQHTLVSIHDTIRDLVESRPKTVVRKSSQTCEFIQDGYAGNSSAGLEKSARRIIELEVLHRQAYLAKETARLKAHGIEEDGATQRALDTYEPPLAGFFKESEFVHLQEL